jgi:hypothetical protein
MFGWWPNSLRRDEALAALSGGLLPLPTFHRGREWQREVTNHLLRYGYSWGYHEREVTIVTPISAVTVKQMPMT